MPSFDGARRQDWHVKLYLTINAQHLCCSYPTDVFLMSFLPRKYPCSFAPPKGIEKQGVDASTARGLVPFKKVVPAPPRLLSSCYVHFHQKQAKWKMPSPLFSSRRRVKTCNWLFQLYSRLWGRKERMSHSFRGHQASYQLGIWPFETKEVGVGQNPQNLIWANPVLVWNTAKWTAAIKVKQKMILTRWTQETTFYGIAADKERGLRFLGGMTFVPSWETTDPHGGPLLASLSPRCRKELRPRYLLLSL